MHTLEGTSLGRYQILRMLGTGGMSAVYLAKDEQMQREVAIKVVNLHITDHTERFRREITALSTLNHEHILPIFDCGEEGQWIYLVMPYTRDGSLRELLARGPLSLEKAGLYLSQIAAALQHAHDNGYIHRDLKPANILLRDEKHAYLADFGLARLDTEESFLTQTGYLMGTPEYMAPELSSQPATASCDIYALGILLYQMLAGRTPYSGSTPFSIYMKHINEEPVHPASINPAIPANIEEIILCALEKDPANRFSSASEMADCYEIALEANEIITMQQTARTPIVSVAALPTYISRQQQKQLERSTLSLANFGAIFANQATTPGKRLVYTTPVKHLQRYLVICAAIVALLFTAAGLGFGMGTNAISKSDGAVAALSIIHVAGKTPTVTPTPRPKTTPTAKNRPAAKPKPQKASSSNHGNEDQNNNGDQNGNGNGNGNGHGNDNNSSKKK